MRTQGRIHQGILVGGMALVLLCSYASAQAGGYLLSGVGDRARSMGGAFTGLADDWSAAFYNPAGAAWIRSSEIYLSGAAFSPRVSYTPDFRVDGDLRVNNMPDGAYYNVDKTYIVPNLGGYAKLKTDRGLSLGLGIFTPIDNNVSWKLFNPYYDSAEPFPAQDVESDINTWNFQPTASFEVVPEHFALGAGMSLEYSEITNHRVRLIQDPGDPFDFPSLNNGFLFTDSYLKGDGWGFGYNLGALAKAKHWSLGVSFRSEMVVKLDGRSFMRMFTAKIDGRGLLSDPLLEQDLLGGKVHTVRQDTKFEMTTPPSLSAGLAFFANDRLRLTGDFSYTWYSQVRGLIVTRNDLFTFQLGAPSDSVLVPLSISEHFEWQDQYRVSVGAEYDAGERLQLRAGWFFEPSPIKVESLSPLYTDIGDKMSPSAGLSYTLGRYTFSYAYGVVFYGSRSVSVWTDDNLPGHYDNVQHESFFSLRYRW